MRSLRFLFIEPFFGDSHKDFAAGLKKHSRHMDRFSWKNMIESYDRELENLARPEVIP